MLAKPWLTGTDGVSGAPPATVRTATLERLGAWALFVMPVATVCWPSTRNAAPLPLLLLAAVMLWHARGRLAGPMSQGAKAVLWAITALACVYLADVLREGHWGRPSEMGFRMLMAWPLYWYARKCMVGPAPWLAGCAAAAAGGLGLALYQVLIEGADRAYGASNAVVFAQAMLGLAVICFAGFLGYRTHERLRWGMALGAACACVAIVFSGTRGAWLALLVLAPVALWHAGSPRHMARAGLLLAFLLIITVSGLQTLTRLDPLGRVTQAHQEASAYEEDPYAPTSVGTRLLMWQFAWHLSTQRPWVGHGEAGYQQRRKLEQAQGRANAQFGIHAHNEMLNMLAKYGLAGLAALLALYVAPLYAAARQRAASWSDRTDAWIWLTLGLLPLAYFLLGLSDVPLAWVEGTALYVYSVALLCAWAEQKKPPPDRGASQGGA